jgi:uncharacterized protein
MPSGIIWSVKFEWDARKARENIRKHGVSFEEALTVFADWDQITIPDDEHSAGEQRFVTLGMSNRGHLLVVPHTERGDRVRIISAWLANARQRRQYENKIR